MRDLLDILRGRTRVYSLTGIIFMAVSGLLLLFWPRAAMALVCRLFGVLLLVYGITLLYRFLKQRLSSFRIGLLIIGIVLIIIGISIFSNPLSVIRFFGALLGLFFLGYGLFSVYRLIRSGVPHTVRWWFLTAGSVFELIIGIMLLVAPVGASALVLRLLGLLLLYAAASSVYYRKRIDADVERETDRAQDTISFFRDKVNNYTETDINGKEIIEGTARDVTDKNDL